MPVQSWTTRRKRSQKPQLFLADPLLWPGKNSPSPPLCTTWFVDERPSSPDKGLIKVPFSFTTDLNEGSFATASETNLENFCLQSENRTWAAPRTSIPCCWSGTSLRRTQQEQSPASPCVSARTRSVCTQGLQRSAKVDVPGCVNAAGKLGQKW